MNVMQNLVNVRYSERSEWGSQRVLRDTRGCFDKIPLRLLHFRALGIESQWNSYDRQSKCCGSSAGSRGVRRHGNDIEIQLIHDSQNAFLSIQSVFSLHGLLEFRARHIAVIILSPKEPFDVAVWILFLWMSLDEFNKVCHGGQLVWLFCRVAK